MTALALQFWPYLLAGAGILWGLWKARQSGDRSALAKQAKAEAKARDVRDEVQNDIGAMPPDQVRAELSRRARP